jgi:PAS domain S-box-containing protein
MNGRLNSLLARLLIGFGIPLVLFLGVALVAWFVTAELLQALEWERHSNTVIIQALEQRQRLDRMHLAILKVPLRQRTTLPESYQVVRREFQQRGMSLKDLVQYDLPQLKRLQAIDDLEKQWHQLIQTAFPKASAKPAKFDLDEVTQIFLEKSQPLQAKLAKEFNAFIGEENRLLDQRRAQIVEQTRQSIIAIVVAVILALLLSVVVMVNAARAVTKPIQELREAAGQLLAGQAPRLTPSGPTEIAQLIVHFNHMAITLSERTSTLQMQEERYRSYLLGSAHILWTTNAAGEVSGDLPAWRAYTGQTEEEIQGLGWLDAIHLDDREEAARAWKEAVSKGNDFESEYRLRSSQGAYRHFFCRGVPIRNSDQSVREWIGTCTDITDRKEEAALRQAKEAAEATSRAKSEFLAKMSHELRTPLNAVIGMSKMLSTKLFGPLKPKQAEYLADITQAGEHLLALINDILDLAKVEAGRLEVKAETFSLDDAVAGLLSTLRPLAASKGLHLVHESAGPGDLETDSARFRQILYNLLSNAIKFTAAKGTVTVRCRWFQGTDPESGEAEEKNAQAIRVDVIDTGIGIAEEHQGAVWEEFRQVTHDGAPHVGTGLGLALTRHLVLLLGGHIWLESQPGQGTTVSCILPRLLPAQPSHPEEAAPNDGPARPLALVIEDHPPTHKLLADWLSDAGMSIASAFDGDAGLAKARDLKPQLIILDIHLPLKDGWQVLAELKADPETADIPVVIVTITGAKPPVDGQDVKEFFVKPLDRDLFLGRLQELFPNLFPRTAEATSSGT